MANLTSQSSQTWISAISKLIELTQKRQIIWKAASTSAKKGFPETTHSPIFRVAVESYQTTHLGRGLLLTRYLPIEIALLTSKMFGHSNEKNIPKKIEESSRFTLEFINEQGEVLHSGPRVDALKHLWNEVSVQSTDVLAFLDELLASDPA